MPVNLNHYAAKEHVYLNGGPGLNAPDSAAGLPAGTYTFQVTGPKPTQLLSSDPLACRQWYLSGFDDLGADTSTIGAAESWPDIVSASGSVIAVIDTGVDFSHPDLIDRAWTNPEDGTRGFDIPGDTHTPQDGIGQGIGMRGQV